MKKILPALILILFLFSKTFFATHVSERSNPKSESSFSISVTHSHGNFVQPFGTGTYATFDPSTGISNYFAK